MNHACYALTMLLSSLASMLLVGPEKCQVSTTENVRLGQTFPCGMILANEAELDSIGQGMFEQCLLDSHGGIAVHPVAFRYLSAGTSLLGHEREILLVQNQDTQEHVHPAGFSIGTGVLVSEYEFSGQPQERLTSPSRPIGTHVPSDLATGYDAAYDKAMSSTSAKRSSIVKPDRDAELMAPGAELVTAREVATDQLFSLWKLTTIRVLRRCANGELWKSSSDALRRERLAAAAHRARLSQVGRYPLDRQIAMRAAEKLDGLGATISAVADGLRNWATRRDATLVSSLDGDADY